MVLELVKKDQNALLNSLLIIYQNIAGVTLEESSSERILLTTMAEIYGGTVDNINYAGRQNFLKYAQNEFLDYLGDNRGIERLEKQPSKTTIRFSFISAGLTSSRVIPQNVTVTNGTYDWIVSENVYCSAGLTYKDVVVECITLGEESNEIAVGEIDSFGNDSQGNIFELDFVESLTNTVATYNGAEEETDSHYKDRLYLALSRLGSQDPQERYIYDLKTEFPDIIDVNTDSVPGEVDVTFLVKNVTAWTTAALTAMLTTVDDYLQTERKKLVDYTINTQLAEAQSFTLAVTITPYLRAGVNSDNVKALASAAIDNWQSGLLMEMGKDVVLSQLILILQGIDGVKEVEITTPSASISIPKNKYASLSSYTVTMNDPEVA